MNLGEAVDVFNLIEQVEGDDPADPGNGFEQCVSARIMILGTFDNIALQFSYNHVICLNYCQIGANAFLDAGGIKALNDTFSVFGYRYFAERIGKIVLASGVLYVGKELRPFAHEMITPPHKVTGGPHFAGIDIGLGNQAATQESGYFMGVDLVILAFAAMNGPHIQGMAEDEGNVFLSTDIGQPLPGKHAFRRYHKVFAVWLDRMEKYIGIGAYVAMQDNFSCLVEDAKIHFVGVKVDSTVILVLFGVKSHEKVSFCLS